MDYCAQEVKCKKVKSFQIKRCVVVGTGVAGRGDAGLRPGDAGLRPLFVHTTLKPTGKKGIKDSGIKDHKSPKPTKRERKKFRKPRKSLFNRFVMWNNYGKN